MMSSFDIHVTDDPAEIEQAIALREQVFVKEGRRARTVETDEIDTRCTHLVAVDDAAVIGTLRLFLKYPNDTNLKIGRVAVRADLRGRDLGRQMMEAVRNWAGTRYDSLYLHAELSVVPFYEKLGYIVEGDPFDEDGTPHILMRLII